MYNEIKMQISEKVSLTAFQQNLWDELQDAWKIPFMEGEFKGAPEATATCALLKLCYIMDQYGWNSELLNNFLWESSTSNF